MKSGVWVQLIGLLGTGLFFLSFQCKNNRRLFRMQLVAYLCYTVHLFLLGAVTGGFSYILNAFRSLCLSSRWTFAKKREMCVLICLMQGMVLLGTWAGWLSALPVAANIAATIGGYTHNPQKIRSVSMLINSPLWILYDVLIGSWAGILDELVTEISILISIVRYGWKNLDRIETE